MASDPIKVFQIGPDGTEYYAACSVEEMKDWYRRTVGSPECEEDLTEYFEEITDLDAEFDYLEDGVKVRKTWRQLAQECAELPNQLSTGYN